MITLKRDHVAPVIATALIAQQVGSNALRDGLFLSAFPVTSLPYFVAGAALIAFPAAGMSGRLLLRFGPARMAPALLALSAALFFAEWALLSAPQAAAVLVYVHSSVLGAIAISSFWSLLNERFDPHSAKPLMAKVAGAATLGGLLGGVGAERVAAMFSQGALLLLLCALGAITVTGALIVARGAAVASAPPPAEEPRSAWSEIRRVPLLRNLALVTMLSATVASLFDYVLKAEAVAWLGKGEPLVRFFGIFYAVTGFGSFLLQATLGKTLLARLGLGGSVASHPIVVGAAGLLGFVAPAPWSGILPRFLDMTLRNSVARAGYELLYTPLPQAAKRSAKSLIDVTGDSIGKGLGALVVMLFNRLAPLYALVGVNIAGVLAAAAELAAARRLRADYVSELEGSLKRQAEPLTDLAEQTLSDFTVVRSLTGIDRATLQKALGEQPAPASVETQDPVLEAFAALRSSDPGRIRRTLESLPRDPVLIGTIIPLLADRRFLRPAVAALESFGPRAAGEMVSALLDSGASEVVRRRLPAALKSCDSPVARDGLASALGSPAFQVRLRAGRALLSLSDQYPALSIASATALSAAEAELNNGHDSPQAREHIFNLLALGLEREPMRIAARAIDSEDAWVRGASLEYIETVVPPTLWHKLRSRFATHVPAAPAGAPRPAAEVRADIIKAGATLTTSLAEVRQRLSELDDDTAED
ncbi:MAG: hypothetical protein JNL98_09535 [Bryobacterales bacterium]|nr:hypothetical protein [Bryobacterales bacterium]